MTRPTRRITFASSRGVVIFGLALFATCGVSYSSHAHLRVRGAARVDGHAGRSHGRMLIEGRILDDSGAAVPSAAIAFAISHAGAEVFARQTACDDAGSPPARTDESGRFCVWIAAPLDSYNARVTVLGTEWLSPAAIDYAVDLAKRSVELKFDPEPRVVTLDAPPASLDAVATYDDDETGAASLPLELSTETGDVIARTTTARGGRGSFVVDPQKLGAPGRGLLRVRFAGESETMASEHVAPIERDVHVSLALVSRLEPSSPEDGVVIDLATQPTATGSVEARVDNVLVGAAPIERGRASLRATFVPASRDLASAAASMQVRFVPDAPWFQPAGELTVTIPLKGPSPWRQAPLAIGAIAVAVWLLAGRSVRRLRLDQTIVMQRPPTHEGTAGISVVHSSRSRTGTFGGKVVDAHDGTVVAQARLVVQVPSFGVPQVLVSVFTDDEGKFEFDLASAPADAELLVEAPLHTELRQKLPGAGVLEIALVSRRRKLLQRLVEWAKRRGPPFDVRPEPTPGQVKRAAEKAHPDAADWAGAVERAAFDKDDVDARVEADVMALDPDRRPSQK